MRQPISTEHYINKIKPIIRKVRFSQLKVDEIAKYMDISKVTLYKHFSSKDDVIRQVVEYNVDFLNKFNGVLRDETLSYIERFQHTFIHSLVSVIYISDIFLEDLKEFYPELYESLTVAQKNRNKGVQALFEEGVQRKVFNHLNAVLSMVQDDAVLRQLIQPSFSIQYDITLKQAILDYYQIKKYQLLRPEYRDQADDEAVEHWVVKICSQSLTHFY